MNWNSTDILANRQCIISDTESNADVSTGRNAWIFGIPSSLNVECCQYDFCQDRIITKSVCMKCNLGGKQQYTVCLLAVIKTYI